MNSGAAARLLISDFGCDDTLADADNTVTAVAEVLAEKVTSHCLKRVLQSHDETPSDRTRAQWIPAAKM